MEREAYRIALIRREGRLYDVKETRRSMQYKGNHCNRSTEEREASAAPVLASPSGLANDAHAAVALPTLRWRFSPASLSVPLFEDVSLSSVVR